VQHVEIGKATRGSQSHKELLEELVFFYNACYVPGKTKREYGHVYPIPLPSFQDLHWPLPNMATCEAFCLKLRNDFHTTMKPLTGSHVTHLQRFMPIHVMADLFSMADSIQKTPTTFVFKNPSEELFNSLIDLGWSSKATINADTVRCTIDTKTVVFCYHIGRSIL